MRFNETKPKKTFGARYVLTRVIFVWAGNWPYVPVTLNARYGYKLYGTDTVRYGQFPTHTTPALENDSIKTFGAK